MGVGRNGSGDVSRRRVLQRASAAVTGVGVVGVAGCVSTDGGSLAGAASDPDGPPPSGFSGDFTYDGTFTPEDIRDLGFDGLYDCWGVWDVYTEDSWWLFSTFDVFAQEENIPPGYWARPDRRLDARRRMTFWTSPTGDADDVAARLVVDTDESNFAVLFDGSLEDPRYSWSGPEEWSEEYCY
jgi:hypothetical protein